MERVLGWVVNDRAAVPSLVASFGSALDLSRGVDRGAFGLGFHHQGEILVKKGPFSNGLDLAERLLGVPARHVVACVATGAPGRRDIDRIQPLRYRNWLFAMSGTDSLPGAFFDAATRHLAGFITPGRWMGTVAEAVMMVFMRALHGVGELDYRGLSTHGIQRALRDGVSTVARLAGGDAKTDGAVLLHVDGYTFGVPLGRPLHVLTRRAGDVPHAPRELRHARAAVVTTSESGSDAHPDARDLRRVLVGADSAVQIGRDAEPQTFELRAA